MEPIAQALIFVRSDLKKSLIIGICAFVLFKITLLIPFLGLYLDLILLVLLQHFCVGPISSIREYLRIVKNKSVYIFLTSMFLIPAGFMLGSAKNLIENGSESVQAIITAWIFCLSCIYYYLVVMSGFIISLRKDKSLILVIDKCFVLSVKQIRITFYSCFYLSVAILVVLFISQLFWVIVIPFVFYVVEIFSQKLSENFLK